MIDLEAFKADYDWCAAFHEAVHHSCGSNYYEDPGPISHVAEVLHAAEGLNDESDWLAVGRWDDGKFFVMSAGCDYTGWDCRAGGTIEFHDTLGEAITDLTPEQAARLGLPHDSKTIA